jgi:MFS family permease
MTLIFALGCVPLYWTVEKFGRRTILLYGAAVMGFLMLIFIVLQAIAPTPAIQWASYAVLCLFMFVSGYAWQGCVWLYVSEIAPLEYRHIGAAATAFGQWLMTFITTFAGPIGLAQVGWKLWIWTLVGCVVSVIYV